MQTTSIAIESGSDVANRFPADADESQAPVFEHAQPTTLLKSVEKLILTAESTRSRVDTNELMEGRMRFPLERVNNAIGPEMAQTIALRSNCDLERPNRPTLQKVPDLGPIDLCGSIPQHFAARCRHASYEPFVLALAKHDRLYFWQIIGLTRYQIYLGAPLNAGRAYFERELARLGLMFRQPGSTGCEAQVVE
jgi:hypothetical protein